MLLTSSGAGLALWLLLRRLGRGRPELSLAWPVATAFLVRVAAAIAVPLTGAERTLRGGDEVVFVDLARGMSGQSLASADNVDAFTSSMHQWLFALHFRFLDDAPDLALRITQVGIAVAGLLLMATAVYELAGPRAGQVVMWVLALEPSNVFFSSILHKEPLMLLAEGLVLFGGARLWVRDDFGALFPMAFGAALAVATRPYVGWFLMAAVVFIALHASINRPSDLRSLALIGVVGVLIAAFVPTVWNASSETELAKLQVSQEANTSERDEANLKLERVDYSTRGDVVLNLPRRIRDVVFRPYPWQVDNLSQRLGMIGTLVVLGALGLLMVTVIQNAGTVMQRAGPFVYVTLFLLAAYALSSGNSGTAFRYRTHIAAVGFCLLLALRERASARRAPGPLPPEAGSRRQDMPRHATAPAEIRPTT